MILKVGDRVRHSAAYLAQLDPWGRQLREHLVGTVTAVQERTVTVEWAGDRRGWISMHNLVTVEPERGGVSEKSV